MSHYTAADILEYAEDIGEGWSRSIIRLDTGDTADSALSTKWVFAGPGTVEYLIHPSGWTIRPEGVHKQYL